MDPRNALRQLKSYHLIHGFATTQLTQAGRGASLTRALFRVTNDGRVANNMRGEHQRSSRGASLVASVVNKARSSKSFVDNRCDDRRAVAEFSLSQEFGTKFQREVC